MRRYGATLLVSSTAIFSAALILLAIGSVFDAVTEQGGAVADDVGDIDSDATLNIDDIIEDAEGQGDEEQSTDVG